MTEKRQEKRQLKSHQDLDVYKLAFKTEMRIFELTKSFPAEERYSFTDQIQNHG